jgi:hypothetical protein
VARKTEVGSRKKETPTAGAGVPATHRALWELDCQSRAWVRVMGAGPA